MVVRLLVDASYGVHKDGKSHTGSCVVIGDVGAVHRGEQQYGGRARCGIQLGQPGAPLKTVPDSTRIQDGTSDPLPGQSVLHDQGGGRVQNVRAT
jgi:hypothetical protein